MKSIAKSIAVVTAFQSINAFAPSSSSLPSSSSSSSRIITSKQCLSPPRLFVFKERSNSGVGSKYSNRRGGRGGGGQGNKQKYPPKTAQNKFDRLRDFENDDDAGIDYFDDYDGYEQEEEDFDAHNNFVEFEDDDEDDGYYYNEDDFDRHDSRHDDSFDRNSRNNNNRRVQESQSNNVINEKDTAVSSTFYSKKTLSDPSFSENVQFFQQLCRATQITRPSRIQSLAWPVLLRGENAIVADQTGSGE